MHICVQDCQQVELPQQAQFINCPTVSNSHTHTQREITQAHADINGLISAHTYVYMIVPVMRAKGF